MIRAETPRDWTIHFRRDITGCAKFAKRELHIPRYKHGYRTLWVFFHELGHALRHLEGKFVCPPRRERYKNRGASSHEEWIAETFAIEMLARYGFGVTASELADAKRNVRDYVRHEKRLGLPVYVPAERFARSA